MVFCFDTTSLFLSIVAYFMSSFCFLVELSLWTELNEGNHSMENAHRRKKAYLDMLTVFVQ